MSPCEESAAVPEAAAPRGVTIRQKVHFRTGPKGRKKMRTGAKPASPKAVSGRIPRISRLMALAIHYDELIRQGLVRDYADLSRLGGVTRARITQVMDLLNLAPEIQAAVLTCPRSDFHRGGPSERDLRPVSAEPDWDEQKALWRVIRAQENLVGKSLAVDSEASTGSS